MIFSGDEGEFTVSDDIEFYFDYISPYAYLGWEATQRLSKTYGVTVVPRPILFAALLNHNDTKGPAEIPSKRRYLFVDLLRKAADLEIPLDVPASHPFNPLLALRATRAADAADRVALATSLFRAVWRDGLDVTQRETLQDLGHGSLLEGATSADVKRALRDETEEAIQEGVFGVPTIRFRGEFFWGVDSLPFLERRLSGEGLPDEFGEKLRRWEHLEPTAARKRAE